MPQYGFFFDQSRCTGCKVCSVACKSWHGLPPGPLKYLKTYEYEKGSFANVRIHFQWVPCYHCEKPACVDACPTGAIYKEEEYGAVLIDSKKCDSCRLCYDACPYGAPVFESDDVTARAQKCDMCVDRLKLSGQPTCVSSCPTRALDFGLLADLMKRYGDNRDLEDMPSSKTTRPAVVFKPLGKKQQIVPYDMQKAVELLTRRSPKSSPFASPHDILEIPEGKIGRSKLVLKHESVADLMRDTRNDEG